MSETKSVESNENEPRTIGCWLKLFDKNPLVDDDGCTIDVTVPPGYDETLPDIQSIPNHRKNTIDDMSILAI